MPAPHPHEFRQRAVVSLSQPLVDRRETDGAGSVAFDPVDAAPDRVLLLAIPRAERGWLAAAMPDLISGLGNRPHDPAPPKTWPVGAGTAGQDTFRPGPGPPTADAGHPALARHGPRLRRITTLTGRHQQRRWFLALLGGQLQIARPGSPRPPSTWSAGSGSPIPPGGSFRGSLPMRHPPGSARSRRAANAGTSRRRFAAGEAHFVLGEDHLHPGRGPSNSITGESIASVRDRHPLPDSWPG
ncbi:hypothetical protein SAMN05421854_106309 [Amycolatopsis rubida]|uniref:Uncharacterized protein n=1 Tax=Amycolatopsis rubida TaxID=112413 RepID=A0A1I5SFN1_9PSEU|nr:hypothetical protein SAMN05421854_106309 [Amycolatopsis rubida]